MTVQQTQQKSDDGFIICDTPKPRSAGGCGEDHLLYGGTSADFNNSQSFSFIQPKPSPDAPNDNPSFTHSHRAYGKAAKRQIDLVLTRLTQLNATLETYISINLLAMVSPAQLKQIIKRVNSFAAANWVGVGIVEFSKQTEYCSIMLLTTDRVEGTKRLRSELHRLVGIACQVYIKPRETQQNNLLEYVFKARVRNGSFADMYRNKRTIMRKHLGIRKHFEFNFYDGTKGKLDKEKTLQRQRKYYEEQGTIDAHELPPHLYGVLREYARLKRHPYRQVLYDCIKRQSQSQTEAKSPAVMQGVMEEYARLKRRSFAAKL